VSDNILNWETQKLMREVAALRADVASLRKMVTQMRGHCLEDVTDMLVRTFERLPEHLRNRRRGFK
jgi:hypothetical protein